jgi:hypothetical protein
MDNKNVNQNRDFSQGKEPKKGQTIGEKLERLGDRISRKGENTEHTRDSQR